MAMSRYLYRGENAELYMANGGRLVPRAIGQPFRQYVYYNGGSYYGAGNTYGDSAANAVIQHQINSTRNPTSGVSTTPHFENARRYATWKHHAGYVFKIDTYLLQDYAVAAFPVAAYAASPTIPGDEEVILVANDFGLLPCEIVVEVLEVSR